MVLQERWASLGVRRAQGAAVLSVALLVLVYYSSWMTRLLTVFQALIIIRCNLKPNEVRFPALPEESVCWPCNSCPRLCIQLVLLWTHLAMLKCILSFA